MPLIDPFGRLIDYLRVSITDRCNFRCIYCMPEEGFPATPKVQQLTPDEWIRLVRIGVSLGIRKVRLTGGEPLLIHDLPDIVRQIVALGVDDLSLTTNGHRLGELAEPLARAGLHRTNVSLDTLRPERFTAIARRGSLATVQEGIRAAQRAGLGPLKINCVTLKGLNDDELTDFAAWTVREPVHVRFIELMPIRWNWDEDLPVAAPLEVHPTRGLIQLKQAPGGMLSDLEMRRRFLSVAETQARIEAAYGPLTPAEIRTNGPARTFRIPGALGTLGFISQMTSDLCVHCNRLRLTHDGHLRPCLMADGEVDLRSPLREGATDDQLADLFRSVVQSKPERHYLADGQRAMGRGMSQIGG